MNDYLWPILALALLLLLSLRALLRHALPRDPVAPLLLKQTLRRLGNGEEDLDKTVAWLRDQRHIMRDNVSRMVAEGVGDAANVKDRVTFIPNWFNLALAIWPALPIQGRRKRLLRWYWKRKGIYTIRLPVEMPDESADAQPAFQLLFSIRPVTYTLDGVVRAIPGKQDHFWHATSSLRPQYTPLEPLTAMDDEPYVMQIIVPSFHCEAFISLSKSVVEVENLMQAVVWNIRDEVRWRWRDTYFEVDEERWPGKTKTRT